MSSNTVTNFLRRAALRRKQMNYLNTLLIALNVDPACNPPRLSVCPSCLLPRYSNNYPRVWFTFRRWLVSTLVRFRHTASASGLAVCLRARPCLRLMLWLRCGTTVSTFECAVPSVIIMVDKCHKICALGTFLPVPPRISSACTCVRKFV